MDKYKVYKRMVLADSVGKMVPIGTYDGIMYQPVYAGNNNFTGQRLYPKHHNTYLRMPAAKALLAIAATLKQQGYGIIIWDAYRPYTISKKMWGLVPDERYVANPAKGSGHNRGIAVDLTLYILDTGQELDMGTGFDNFTDSAHHGFKGLNAQQQANRNLLKKAMEEHGFTSLATEWWHYSWSGKTFPVLDLSFGQLAKLTD
ncbi:M15 family metallopeptidase [Cnuella takakiae]|uniref:M15 family metallopeptidase n=1 Tax=Cnuella takakiae TaxID=1302690 RepID=UPI001300D0FA|nr:M15 family metallopeptidase [Cnuella takakiae]